MKYVIKNQEPEEAVVKLYLWQKKDEIYLCADDITGFDWKLLKIKDGKIFTVSDVDSKKTGFEVDENGEIEIYCWEY